MIPAGPEKAIQSICKRWDIDRPAFSDANAARDFLHVYMSVWSLFRDAKNEARWIRQPVLDGQSLLDLIRSGEWKAARYWMDMLNNRL